MPPSIAKFEIRGANEVLAKDPQLREPLIDGVARRGEVVNVIAPPKSGKSWLVLDMAFAVARGELWLGIYETHKSPVLILDAELHVETMDNRVCQMAKARGLLRESLDGLSLCSLRGKEFDILSVAEWIRDDAVASESGLIIFDALYQFLAFDTDENANGQMTHVYRELDKLASDLNATVVVIHHPSKGDQSSKKVTDIGAGAGAQSRAADCHMVLRPHKETNHFVLEAEVRSFIGFEPVVLKRDLPTWTHVRDGDPHDLKRPGNGRSQEDIEEAILGRLKKVPDTKTGISEAIHVTGKRLDSILDSLIKEGRIQKCKVSKGNKHEYDGYGLP